MNKKIILASQSPRRKQLLKQLGLKFEVRPSEYEEDMSARKDPYELVKFLALNKAKDVIKHYKNAIIIGSDTIIIHKNHIIGKPRDKDQARKMLRCLSGNEHEVATGFAVIDTENNKIINDFNTAKVKFRELSDQEIEDYVNTGEPLDKAGSYGIQSKGAILIESVKGDYFSVVGLPIGKIYLALRELNINLK